MKLLLKLPLSVFFWNYYKMAAACKGTLLLLLHTFNSLFSLSMTTWENWHEKGKNQFGFK